MPSLTWQKQEESQVIRHIMEQRVDRTSHADARQLCVNLTSMLTSRMTLKELQWWRERLEGLEGEHGH